MAVSKRAKRMARHHKKKNQPGLNLVSLMDIFTILVFFLLVNSSSAPQLPSNKDLNLPKSTAKKAPAETVIVVVTQQDIMVQGEQISTVKSALSSAEEFIPKLTQVLKQQGSNNAKAQDDKWITIMADEDLSYELIRKIVASCQQANFNNVAFAATQIADKSS